MPLAWPAVPRWALLVAAAWLRGAWGVGTPIPTPPLVFANGVAPTEPAPSAACKPLSQAERVRFQGTPAARAELRATLEALVNRTMRGQPCAPRMTVLQRPGLNGYNFGEDLSVELFRALSGGAEPDKRHFSKLLLGGSTLEGARVGDIVAGAGFRLAPTSVVKPDPAWADLRVTSVRGRLSRDRLLALGVRHVPAVFGDPALFVPELLPWLRGLAHVGGGGICLMPHMTDKRLKVLGLLSKLRVISSVDLPPKGVLNELLDCDLLVTSSLHGLVVADALGMPSMFAHTSSEGLNAYADYLSGLAFNVRRRAPPGADGLLHSMDIFGWMLMLPSMGAPLRAEKGRETLAAARAACSEGGLQPRVSFPDRAWMAVQYVTAVLPAMRLACGLDPDPACHVPAEAATCPCCDSEPPMRVELVKNDTSQPASECSSFWGCVVSWAAGAHQ